jgi:hypothetical protein
MQEYPRKALPDLLDSKVSISTFCKWAGLPHPLFALTVLPRAHPSPCPHPVRGEGIIFDPARACGGLACIRYPLPSRGEGRVRGECWGKCIEGEQRVRKIRPFTKIEMPRNPRTQANRACPFPPSQIEWQREFIQPSVRSTAAAGRVFEAACHLSFAGCLFLGACAGLVSRSVDHDRAEFSGKLFCDEFASHAA